MSWFYTTSLLLLAPLVLLLVLTSLEVGHRLSRALPIREQQFSMVSAPILGIVGLLLAFSFGMAGERHAQRRAAGVQEANAIGTFWLRTSLLPEPLRSQMRSQVRRYVDVHVEHRAAGIDATRMSQLETEVAHLQSELWTLLQEDSEHAPDAARLHLLAPALNAMIDSAATMLAAKENRLPDPLLLFLLLLVFIAGVLAGYRPATEGREPVLWGIFVIVIGGMLLMLLDIDRPRRGLIAADFTPFVRLRESLQDDPRTQPHGTAPLR